MVIFQRIRGIPISGIIEEINGASREGMTVVIDPSGLKITQGGDWLTAKWKTGRKGWIKMNVVSLTITDLYTPDTKEFRKLLYPVVDRASSIYGDGGYDSRKNFQYLSNRGVREPLLFVADRLPKIDEEVRRVFPRADFQLRTIHASRNFKAETRESDKLQIDRELKRVFTADTKEDALARLSLFKAQWSKKYPRQICNLEKKVNYLFTYFSYPQSVRRSLHSNNIIERMNKEVRRRIKVIDPPSNGGISA